MQYMITTPRVRSNPLVTEIIDTRTLNGWLADPTFTLDSGVRYINQDGDLVRDADGYEVEIVGGDCLLVTLEDGTAVVSSIDGMRVYMRRTEQSFPVDLR
jgi:hypothetical protein